MDGPPAASAPRRIQLLRTKGWRKPEGAIVVSRPTVWGNPWRITKCWRVECGGRSGGATWCVFLDPDEHLRQFTTERGARLFAVRSFAQLDLDASGLAGHDLACWCPLDAPCHGDVLLELANGVAS